MRNSLIVSTLALMSLAALGCYNESTPIPDATSATTATLPATLFSGAAPAGVTPLAAVKADAKPGDQVVFEARVGGRKDPFVANRAVFFVTDSAIPDCQQLHGDGCKTPWDYCCEPRESLMKGMATIQVVDGSGQPLKTSIQNAHGLEPSRTVMITGTVDQMDEAGTFVVNAQAIHIAKK